MAEPPYLMEAYENLPVPYEYLLFLAGEASLKSNSIISLLAPPVKLFCGVAYDPVPY